MESRKKNNFFSLSENELELIIIKLFNTFEVKTNSKNEDTKLLKLFSNDLKNFYNIDISKFPKKENEEFISYFKNFLKNKLIDFPEQTIGLKSEKKINLESIIRKHKNGQ